MAFLLVGVLVVGACGDGDDLGGVTTTTSADAVTFAEDLERICALRGSTPGGAAAIVPLVQHEFAALDPSSVADQATLAALIDLFDRAQAAIEAGQEDEAEASIDEASAIVRDQGVDCGDAPRDLAALTQPDAVIDIGGSIGQVTAAGDDVWVTDFDEPVVTRVQASTGEIISRITLDDRELRTIQVTDSGVWVRGASAVHRIDPATNRVASTVAKDKIGTNITRVFVDETAMWACSSSTLMRTTLDGDPTGSVDLGFPCGTVTSASGQVWVASDKGSGYLAKIDPATLTVLLTTDLPIDFATFPSIDGGTVWTHSQADAVEHGFVAVDAVTGDVLFQGALDSGGGPGALTDSKYYAPDSDIGEVLVIDRTTGEVVDHLDGGSDPNAAAVSTGHLWVVDDERGELRRFDV